MKPVPLSELPNIKLLGSVFRKNLTNKKAPLNEERGFYFTEANF